MPFKPTTFSRLLSLIPRHKFQECVNHYEGDRYAKKFFCWDQLVSMLYLQISGKRSLRELTESFNSHEKSIYHLGVSNLIKRSTLSDANDHRDHRIYSGLLDILIRNYRKQLPRALSRNLHILDSTFFSLHRTLNAWASQGHRVYGIKMHLLYASEQGIPIQVHLTQANINDPTFFDHLRLEKNTIYLFDRGYWDFEGWQKILSKKSDFLTRVKNKMAYQAIQSLELKSPNILSDDYVFLTSKTGRKVFKNKVFRLIKALDHQGRKIELITSRLHDSAAALVELYRERWAIEIFFKWIKQNLRIKRYVGQSENAIRTQILIAIIAFLLIRACHEISQSTSNLRYFFVVFAEHLMKSFHRKIFDPHNKFIKPHFYHGVTL